MKVKIRNTIYDSQKEPIMVILTPTDKKNIANMLPDCTKYCAYPDTHEWTTYDGQTVKQWMDEMNGGKPWKIM